MRFAFPEKNIDGENMKPSKYIMQFNRRPGRLGSFLRAMYPSRGLQASGMPDIRAEWREPTADNHSQEDFRRLAGLDVQTGNPADQLFMQTMTFPLQFAILSHRVFPVPIWRMLQTRNRMLSHRSPGRDAPLEISGRAADWRVLEKGLEVDIHIEVCSGGKPAWEGWITFFSRGRFSGNGRPVAQESPTTAQPQKQDWEGGSCLKWNAPVDGGREFSRLSGDGNPLHTWGWYARRMGWRGATLHPHRLAAQCLDRLGSSGQADSGQIELWFKGPVYYGAPLEMKHKEQDGVKTFALWADNEPRPVILGRLR